MKLLTPIAQTFPVGQELLQRLVGADRASELAGQRLVQDQQVDLLDAELAGTLVERVQRLVVSEVADPHLGLDEHRRPVQTGAADRLPDLALIAVGRGGVDVAVARRQRRLHG